MYDPPGPEPAYVQVAKSAAWTLQAAAIVALALGPLLAGFLAPLGPPQHTLAIDGVGPADDAGDALAYDNLSAESRDLFDAAFESSNDAAELRTGDPPAILASDGAVIVRDGVAYRVSTASDQPLRFPAILAGLLGSTLTTLLGAAIAERNLV